MKMPEKIFQGLQGRWDLSRTLLSTNQKFSPSGKVQGVAKFTLISENEMHYSENGRFTTDTGKEFEVKAEYIYLYNVKEERVEKYFSQKGNKTNRFYILKIENSKTNKDIKVTGEHQCSNDNYRATYKFLGGADFNKFVLTYHVKGPSKDYVSETIFERSSSEIESLNLT